MVLAVFFFARGFRHSGGRQYVLSFAEVFADAGFQNTLFSMNSRVEEKHKSATVAFWTNIIVSAVLFTFIVVFRNPISGFLGSPGNGTPIAVGSVSLFLIAFSSIQMALFKREFDFKKLFIIRIFAILVPFIVTIPLAILKFSYWSLIIGTITTNVLNAILLTIFSKWKPRFFYSFKLLKEMFSFTFLTNAGIIDGMAKFVDGFIYYRALFQ
jgi:PST family polysaccharide transporter